MKFLLLLIISALFYLKSFPQTVAIASAQAHTLYQKIDNTLTIVVEKCACEDVIVKTSNGILTGNGCKYAYNADDCVFETTIKVGTKKHGIINWLTETWYHVKQVPDPVETPSETKPLIKLSKAALIANGRIDILQPDLCTCPEIASYSLIIIRDSVIFKSVSVLNNLIGGKAYDFIKNNCIVGDLLFFDNVEFKNDRRFLPPFGIKIVSP